MQRVDRGDYGGAGQVLQEARAEIVGANLPMSAPEAAALEDLEQKLNQREYKSYRKMASAQNYRRNYQRSAGHSDLRYAFQKGPRLGDITKEKAEAIVNSTDRNLSDSGALSRAIHQAAGPELLQACRDLQGCTVGGAKLTPGFNLRANWVIHTVAPKWKGGNQGEETLLVSCYQNCLQLAVAHNIRSLAFPAIACGAMGFPRKWRPALPLKPLVIFSSPIWRSAWWLLFVLTRRLCSITKRHFNGSSLGNTCYMGSRQKRKKTDAKLKYLIAINPQ
ncbi:macro domain-containing protein (plasmid) [Synechocystis sp. B12]|nr:macro domain-containing protein [Synechocystis sp. B12]